jgi:hypothetical protein
MGGVGPDLFAHPGQVREIFHWKESAFPLRPRRGCPHLPSQPQRGAHPTPETHAYFPSADARLKSRNTMQEGFPTAV